MKFIKNWLINIVALSGIGLIIYLIMPDITKMVYEVLWGLLGPLLIPCFLVATLPYFRRRF